MRLDTLLCGLNMPEASPQQCHRIVGGEGGAFRCRRTSRNPQMEGILERSTDNPQEKHHDRRAASVYEGRTCQTRTRFTSGKFRPLVEEGNHGKIVAIDIDTGVEVADKPLAGCGPAAGSLPEAQRWWSELGTERVQIWGTKDDGVP